MTLDQYDFVGNPRALTWLLGRPPTPFEELVRARVAELRSTKPRLGRGTVTPQRFPWQARASTHSGQLATSAHSSLRVLLAVKAVGVEARPSDLLRSRRATSRKPA